MHTKQHDWAEMLTGESGDGGPVVLFGCIP
jgi:hypothetical protein